MTHMSTPRLAAPLAAGLLAATALLGAGLPAHATTASPISAEATPTSGIARTTTGAVTPSALDPWLCRLFPRIPLCPSR